MLAGQAARVRAGPCENQGVSTYYDIDSANARLEALKPILAALRKARDEVAAGQLRLSQLQSVDDADPELLAREQEGLTVTVRQMEQAVRQIDAWDVTLYADNLLDKYAVTGVRTDTARIQVVPDFNGDDVNVRSYFHNVLKPLTIGVRATYRFDM